MLDIYNNVMWWILEIGLKNISIRKLKTFHWKVTNSDKSQHICVYNGMLKDLVFKSYH